MNSRPLTYIDSDLDSGAPLTPGHFLSINYKTGVPEIELEYSRDQDTRLKVLQMWKKGQTHLDKFWKVWLTEYLPSLREKGNIHMKSIKGEINRKPHVGEVVIIKEEDLPRGKWKLARVVNLIKGEIDNIERAATLQYTSGRITKRPFQLLH